ncbi:MAG: hypothetical protein ACPGPF_09920, partial [Pontibacterium sp.]
EFLADASAVQFTRNPQGIAGALKVIGGFQAGTKVANANSSQLSHLFFGQALTSSFSGLFNTHPPLKDRIKAIDPQWDGKYINPTANHLNNIERSSRAQDSYQDSHAAEVKQATSQGLASGMASGAMSGWAASSSPSDTYAGIRTGDVDQAQQMLANIPQSLQALAREPMGAMALVFAVLRLLQQEEGVAASDEAKYNAECETLLKGIPGLLDEVKFAHKSLANLPRPLFFPLIELCFPALKCLSLVQFKAFRQQVLAAIRLDKKIDLQEWCLFQLLTHYLDPEFGYQKPSKPRYKEATEVSEGYALVLSLLAHEGHDSSDQAQQAFDRAANSIGLTGLTLLPLDRCRLNNFSQAVDQLASSRPLLKAMVIRSFVDCVQHDGEVKTLEYEILRSIAAVMDSPIPQLGVE